MFVPVACSQCGKPFQVPAEAVGKAAACPWCQAAVLALPVGSPVAVPGAENRGLTPPARQEQPEPLSLDDEPAPRASPKPRVRKMWLWLAAVAGVLALAVATLATVAYLRYHKGYMTSMEWTPFTAPDGSCSVELLGKPKDDVDAPAGERRYVSVGWYSGTVAWVGWRDLTQVEIQLAGTKEPWQHFTKTFETERKRLQERYGGPISDYATYSHENPIAHRVRLVTPNGAVVERMIVMHKGSRPRIYFVGMSGRFDPDGDQVKRLFDSFKVSE